MNEYSAVLSYLTLTPTKIYLSLIMTFLLATYDFPGKEDRFQFNVKYAIPFFGKM